MNFIQHHFAVIQNKFKSQGSHNNTALAPDRGAYDKVAERDGNQGAILQRLALWQKDISRFLARVQSIGVAASMQDHAKRKLRIFNLLNFLNLIAGVIVPVTGLLQDRNLPAAAWAAAFAPPLISVLVLTLNWYKKHEAGMIAYFILYPVITSVVYLNGINLGVDLFFILYGILAVFFLSRISDMLFSIGLSMISYFMLAVVLKNYIYKLETANFGLYLFNQALAILLIFYGLFLIKRENAGYERLLLNKNDELGHTNNEIQSQKAEIVQKATLLEDQAKKLEELNSLKNKLFSVVSHDLKAPMYALRNLFQNVQDHNLPGEEIKTMLPEVINDLNYTTGLMENLLQWAKSQMQLSSLYPQRFDITRAFNEVMQPLRLPAKEKEIDIQFKFDKPLYVYADKDMINLVVRNLVSNAIKFTPVNGKIFITVKDNKNHVRVSVRDTGVGISAENQKRLFKEFYSSNGTFNESGTGLGLMLCKEFLGKNGGNIELESKEGEGSTFSFTLPTADVKEKILSIY
jgi:two-component system, sensor histidine kinase and response regulator